MADKDVLTKSLDVPALLNTAIKNVRLYPRASASVSAAIEKLHLTLADLLTKNAQIVFAESEKALLIDGQSLGQKDQERPHIVSLINILLDFGLSSLTLCRGLEKDELERLVFLLSRGSESVLANGGLAAQLTSQKIPHVLLDQKIYVAIDKDHQLLVGLDTASDQITNLFAIAHPGMDPASSEFREMAANPEALAEAFKTGLAKMMAQKDTMTGKQLSDSLNSMLSLVDKIAVGLDDQSRSLLSERVGQAMLEADPVLTGQMTTQHMESLFGGLLLQYLMAELARGKMDLAGSGGNNASSGDTQNGAKDRLLQVAEKFSLRLQDARTLLDDELMAVLPKIIEQLVAQKEQEVLDNLLERLAANLMNDDADVRLSAARSLIDIMERLPAERKNEVIQKLSMPLVAWINYETVFSPEYQKLCTQMKKAAEDHLSQGQVSEAVKYGVAFRAVADGTGKTEAIIAAAQNALSELATPANIDILLDEIVSPDNQKREDAGRLFMALGNTAVEDLLDELKTKTDGAERIRIMQLIGSAREKALPLVVKRISKEAPWFYLRNIAYLLGQIGNEDSARTLAPLLTHKNDKLRQEALKSIYRTGGSQRSRLLLEALSLADDDSKAGIVDALGQAKTVDAVPALVELLRNRPLITTVARMTLEERICSALGTIGSADAVALLSEIAQSKTFLKLNPYPEKVKAAAVRSLAILERRVSSAGRAAG